MLRRNVFTKGLSQKLQNLYMGPYKIVKQLGPLHYRLKNLNDQVKKKYTKCHVDRIKIIGKHLLEDSDDIELTPTPTITQPSSHPSSHPTQPTSKQLKRLHPTSKSKKPTPITSAPLITPQQQYTNRYGRLISQPIRYTK